MLLSRAATSGFICRAAALHESRSADSVHSRAAAGVFRRPAAPCSQDLHGSGSRTICWRPRGRRSLPRVTALPAEPPSTDTANLQQVWPLLQQMWQALLDSAGSQPPSDIAAASALQQTGASAQQTLLMLHLLRSGCNAAQLSASASAMAAPAAVGIQQQSDQAAAAAPQPQTALAVAAKGSSGSSGSGGGGGSRGGSVQPPCATAQLAAGQTGPGGSGGGGSSGKVAKARRPDIGTLWGLLVLGLAYVHHSTTGAKPP